MSKRIDPLLRERAVRLVREASQNPLSWGIQPGGLIIAPFAMLAVGYAEAQLGEATSSARDLIGRLLPQAPEALGNREGLLPYAVRDEANRGALGEMLREDALTPEQRRALEAVQAQLGSHGDVPVQLILLDVSGSTPLAAISIGDLDAADYASLIVPSMNTTVEGSMHSMRDSGVALYDEMPGQLDHSGGGRQAATVAWIGNETPNALSVMHGDAARAGAERLSATIEGFGAIPVRTWASSRRDREKMSPNSPARLRRTTAVAALLLALTGCTTVKEDPGMNDGHDDYLAAEAVLLGTVEATQTAAGGSWETPRTRAMECPLPAGGTGARLSYASVARGAFDADASYAAVRPVWTGAGLAAREGDPLADSRMFYAEGSGGLVIELGIGPAAQTVNARSDCAPGDAAEINIGLQAG